MFRGANRSWKGLLFLCSLGAAMGAMMAASALTRVSNPELAQPALPQLYDFHTVDAFPGLSFERPVRLTAPPDETDRLFVVEQGGRILVLDNLENPEVSVFLDLTDRTISEEEAGLLNLAFHPSYSENGLFFIFYTLNDTSSQGTGLHDRLSRFQVSAEDPNRADVGSEVVLINQIDRHFWHNAGALAFGPDGYLYLTVGDEGSGSDEFENSQLIDANFYSGLLRLDVDMREGNLVPNTHPAAVGNYLVPADNPFVGASTFNGLPVNPTEVRTEFYAVGLRNAWRFSFDYERGILFCNDTGEVTREEINVIRPGGNYGWAYWEGSLVGPRWNEGVTESGYERPIVEYGRELGNDVAASLFYRGSALPALDGRLVFSDFWNGYLGAISYDGDQASPIEWLVWDSGISDMGTHPGTSEILLADWLEGKIKRLEAGPDPAAPPMPRLLSETGLFEDLETLTPSEGLVPYEINVSFWSDNAIKQRWFGLPRSDQAFHLRSEDEIGFPPGAVWVKHFDLELRPGDPSSIRRLETRLLVQTAFGLPYGATYRWGDSTSDAELVPTAGANETFLIEEPDGIRTQVWRYPSRRECFSCHGTRTGGVLGFTPAQLNRQTDYGQGAEYQLEALNEAGYFFPPLASIHTLPALAPLDDESHSLEYRVRSYLQANCLSCHQPEGISAVDWDARIIAPLAAAKLLDAEPSNHLGNPAARVIAPGSLDHSVLYRRISQGEVGRMPPLASSVLDQQAIDLLREWIESDLPKRSTFQDWQSIHFDSVTDPAAQWAADPDRDRATNYLEFLTQTDPLLSGDGWRINVRTMAAGVEIKFRQLPNLRYQVQWTDFPLDLNLWLPLDAPSNRDFVAAEAQWTTVLDPRTFSSTRFYRVVVLEH